jgi:hypothetical protein
MTRKRLEQALRARPCGNVLRQQGGLGRSLTYGTSKRKERLAHWEVLSGKYKWSVSGEPNLGLTVVTRIGSTTSRSLSPSGETATRSLSDPALSYGCDKAHHRDDPCGRRGRISRRRSGWPVNLPSAPKIAGIGRLDLVDHNSRLSGAYEMLVEGEVRESDEGGRSRRDLRLEHGNGIEPADLARKDCCHDVVREQGSCVADPR